MVLSQISFSTSLSHISPPLFRNTRAISAGRISPDSAQDSKCAVVLPGLGRGASSYDGLGKGLEKKGFFVETCAVRTVDWLRNAAGVTDINYWKGTLNPRPTVDWYLTRIDAAIEKAKRKTDGAPITIVAHSAGGWLARLYMKDYGTMGIENLVTLGAPHSPPQQDKGVFDQTRGILHFCENEVPGCYHPEVKYITVAGKYVKGSGWNGDGSFGEKLIGTVYKQVCGEAGVWGDGVVPNVSSHLEGATNLDLENVFHGPITQSNGRVWYGSPEILEQWLDQVSVTEKETAISDFQKQ